VSNSFTDEILKWPNLELERRAIPLEDESAIFSKMIDNPEQLLLKIGSQLSSIFPEIPLPIKEDVFETMETI
jgi:hypothetical protein